MVCFGDRHPTPERTGIGSIPMKLHHPVEELARGCRLLVETQEVPEVAARFLDDPRVIVVLGPWMLEQLVSYTQSLYMSIPQVVG